MRTLTRAGRVVIGTLFMLGCQSLDITNPNAPDASRALTDPSAIEAIAGGTLRSFFNTYNGLEAVGPLTTQARSHTASWNNYNMNFYSSVDGDGTRRTRGWQNDPATSRRTAIEWFWQGYYSTASSAMDVLIAIRNNDLSLGSVAATARAEAVAELMLGASLGQIAINYDKGYVIDETADLTSLEYVDRKVLRDAALLKLENAARIATANSFTLPSAWTNGGGTYTNLDVARIARTMAAMTLAYWPRTEAENTAMGTTYWARVATLASQGLSKDFVFVGDGCEAYCPEMQSWTNDIFGIRVHTRVANRMDPTIKTPYDSLNDGSPQPNSPDARLGDGSFGTADMEGDYGTVAKTANAGTDFAWSGYEAFFATRGQYHQSNIAHIRWDASGTQATNSIYYGYGPVPLVMKAQNDLIHAEALLRSGGSTATAATLINNTRVGRGKLAAATSGEGVTSLLAKVDYENEIELLSQGASTFYNRRRVANGLIEGTPREMPVPAKELGVKVEALYTWGGTGNANSATPANAGTLPP